MQILVISRDQGNAAIVASYGWLAHIMADDAAGAVPIGRDEKLDPLVAASDELVGAAIKHHLALLPGHTLALTFVERRRRGKWLQTAPQEPKSFEHFGWCIGELKKKNTGKRRKIDGKMVKFERGGDHRGLPVPGGRRVTYIPRRGLSVLAPAGA